MSTEYYFLSVNATGLNAAIKINDLPVIILNEGTELMTEKMVASWLMNGENCLSAALIALPEQEQIQGKIKATLFLHDNTKISVINTTNICTNLLFFILLFYNEI